MNPVRRTEPPANNKTPGLLAPVRGQRNIVPDSCKVVLLRRHGAPGVSLAPEVGNYDTVSVRLGRSQPLDNDWVGRCSDVVRPRTELDLRLQPRRVDGVLREGA